MELNYVKRPFRPLYGWTQATPKSGFLDPAWTRSVAIYPGMVMTKTSGNNYTLMGSGTNGNPGTSSGGQVPAGFVSQFIGGYGIDELLEAGVNALSIWELGPDAEFEVLAPAFDTTQTWVDPGDGTDVLVYASCAGSNQGQLVPSGAANASYHPVARLVQIESATSMVIAGLKVRAGTAG